MKKSLHLIILISSLQIAFAQVGIGTITPSPTVALQVAGNAKLSGELTLENPGEFTTNVDNSQRYLIVNTTGNVNRYLTGNGASKAKYSPVNYATYKLQNLALAGVTDFDTKIPADKYIVSIQSFEFDSPNPEFGEDPHNTIFDSTTGTDSVNGIVYKAFRSGGTWHLAFYGVDSNLIKGAGPSSQLDLILEVVIYRNKLLMADDDSVISVNMGGSTTGSVAAPTGY